MCFSIKRRKKSRFHKQCPDCGICQWLLRGFGNPPEHIAGSSGSSAFRPHPSVRIDRLLPLDRIGANTMDISEHSKPASAEASCHRNSSKYHVFLSFRGPDLRKSLVDHLYESLSTAGIHVFLDSQKLQTGHNIGLKLEEAIRDSHICIPIFSTNFAHSPWCLSELSLMCTSGGITIPLFYDVDPSDVRHPDTGRYSEAFKKHCSQGRYSQHTIGSWKDALRQAASLSGWTMTTTSGYEGKLVKQIVLDVLKILNNVPLDVAKRPVGLKHRVDAVTGLMKLGGYLDDRGLVIGIWGMGGIGKTTLSKAVVNEIHGRFEAFCFVSEVRTTARQFSGLKELQAQVLRDLSKVELKVNNVDHGKSLMRDRLGSSRALLVLDDVDEPEQLDALAGDWFGRGSRILVTTRDKHVLNVGQLPHEIYRMEELEHCQALELFSWHAFLRACPDRGYEDLSNRIVKACGGLPLALEVVGAHLYDKKHNTRCWMEAATQIECVMDKSVYEALKVSYDALKPHEQQIFLDIACFFIGEKREVVIPFWEASADRAVHTAIANLWLKSLIRVSDDDRFLMHDHLRDLGREIVEERYREVPGKRTRLWRPRDVYRVLQQREGTKRIRGLIWTKSESAYEFREAKKRVLHMESLASMLNLQLLSVKEANIEGEMEKLPPNLKWLALKNCCLKWESSQSKHQMPENLRVLQLTDCYYLKRLPDFSNNPHIVRLELKRCYGVSSIPDSFGGLWCLEQLSLEGCRALGGLPRSIGQLQRLSYLNMNLCLNLLGLPEEFGNLVRLRELLLNYCHNLRELPQSFGRLMNLRNLEMNYNTKLLNLPENFGNLGKMRTLEMNGNESLGKLPASFARLKSLVHLEADFCNIRENGLPCQIGDLLSKLEILDLQRNRFCTLPDSFSRFPKLTKLILRQCCNLVQLPTLPACLTEADISDCWKLARISSLSHLKKLQILNACHCESLTGLPGLGSLTSLIELDIGGCKHIVEGLSGMERLKSLQRLNVRRCRLSLIDLRQCIQELPCLRELALSADGVPEWLKHKLQNKGIRFIQDPAKSRGVRFSPSAKFEKEELLEDMATDLGRGATSSILEVRIHGRVKEGGSGHMIDEDEDDEQILETYRRSTPNIYGAHENIRLDEYAGLTDEDGHRKNGVEGDNGFSNNRTDCSGLKICTGSVAGTGLYGDQIHANGIRANGGDHELIAKGRGGDMTDDQKGNGVECLSFWLEKVSELVRMVTRRW